MGLLLSALAALAPLPKLEVRPVATAEIVTAPAAPVMSTPAPRIMAPAPRPVLASTGFPVVNAMLELDQPLDHGEYAWNADGVPAGKTWIVVDISTQTLHAFRGGTEIGRAVVLYGADDAPTPLGRFTITQKKRHHISNLYGAEMPFMMRLTNDGVAIHASDVEQDAATHGCVGVPTEFAELLFAEARVGTPVLMVNGGAFKPVPTA